jgi:SpoVK/Ycf46/Vps4 family AAA+-type ATPase
MSKSEEIQKYFAQVLRDRTISAKDRADIVVYGVGEHGIDSREAIADVVLQLDKIAELQEALALQEQATLVSERYMGKIEHAEGHLYAMVTRGPANVYLPIAPADVEGLNIGDQVLVNPKSDRIVGRDGAAPTSGDVVRVESRPSDDPQHVYVKHHDQLELARLHHELANDPTKCQPGTEVVYDAERNFVVAEARLDCGGDDLLVDLAAVPEVRREAVGAPHPVVDEILDDIRIGAERKEWAEQMGKRDRRSYLFVGITGGGKSHHLKLISTELHDWIEQQTGHRTSRLIMVDASQFWSPYFGETEQRIARWADKLYNLGKQTLTDRNGHAFRSPIVVVIEECETLLRSRNDGTSNHLFDRPLGLLLQKTESLEGALEVPIIWLATTNRPDLADAAALRRIGVRRVNFRTLNGSAARAVLAKKIPSSMPIAGDLGSNEERRTVCIDQVAAYLQGDEPPQELAVAVMDNSERRPINRRDLVTPAVLEEAVSWAIDRCLSKSVRQDKLLGLDARDVIEFLHRHYSNLARTLRVHNIAEYCPQWFDNEGPSVRHVEPSSNTQRRPASLLVA